MSLAPIKAGTATATSIPLRSELLSHRRTTTVALLHRPCRPLAGASKIWKSKSIQKQMAGLLGNFTIFYFCGTTQFIITYNTPRKLAISGYIAPSPVRVLQNPSPYKTPFVKCDFRFEYLFFWSIGLSIVNKKDRHCGILINLNRVIFG